MRGLLADEGAEPQAAGEVRSESPADTLALGRAIGSRAEPATLVALYGPLGAGKTLLAKGIAAGLGVTSVVNSPTFVLMNEHPGRLRLFHVDAYRLAAPEDAMAAGLLDERQAAGVTVVEWADRIGDHLPDDRLDIWLHPDATDTRRRRLTWRAGGAAHTRLAAEALRR